MSSIKRVQPPSRRVHPVRLLRHRLLLALLYHQAGLDTSILSTICRRDCELGVRITRFLARTLYSSPGVCFKDIHAFSSLDKRFTNQAVSLRAVNKPKEATTYQEAKSEHHELTEDLIRSSKRPSRSVNTSSIGLCYHGWASCTATGRIRLMLVPSITASSGQLESQSSVRASLSFVTNSMSLGICLQWALSNCYYDEVHVYLRAFDVLQELAETERNRIVSCSSDLQRHSYDALPTGPWPFHTRESYPRLNTPLLDMELT
ncbi:hypothetical protein CONLIGDRAFT_647538 [Coniochaeta ligniaria NRRL 30616]|uniref:Uncharacterized protein n=1 Tax=Coniochaeta ligniaria NRRL 30616 TaxID=1408157 RepID=A0A1J7IEC1_9PEZI|nr:hypothetical protein CONLIGDRAFT_647538 [Coniochaeta ligniaria NRRL 30616]